MAFILAISGLILFGMFLSLGGGLNSLLPPSLKPKNLLTASLDPTGTAFTKEVLEGLEPAEPVVPGVTPAADAPSVTDPEVQEAKRKERELNRRRRGRRSTLLTGPSGTSDDSQKKTLLGG